MKVLLLENIETLGFMIYRKDIYDVIKDLGDYWYLDRKDCAVFIPFCVHKKYCKEIKL